MASLHATKFFAFEPPVLRLGIRMTLISREGVDEDADAAAEFDMMKELMKELRKEEGRR